ncbi:MAG TPA: 5'-3' exonuclease H3TH domain-containing protein, partial [Candidatus Polarisedimenticolaceae bacterium]|nr:5'-3' exonuclease H3TH domain-containing protein [Candidatus Polarisedimenticolaceae bacterium]
MPKVYLIDGTSQLFRAFFAVRGLANADGIPTGAVFGFTSMLRKLINDEHPEYIGVFWDLEGPTFRHGSFADYKANRPPMPEDLAPQFDYAKQVCEGLRIPSLELEGYEADDLIATYARLAKEAGYEVVVVASDKDLLQLVGDGVIVLNPSKDIKLDAAGVADYFGAPPERVRDVLGLMGDAVDNIPGVPGVGEKTALALVQTYGGIDDIVARATRFVAAMNARDGLVAALETGEGIEPAATLFADTARENLASEKDPAFAERLEAALELAAVARDGLNPKERKLLAKTLKDLDKGSQRRIWQAVAEHADQARLSRDLATVDANAPVTFDPAAFRMDVPDREKLGALFTLLGFRSLTAEFTGDPVTIEGATGRPALEEAPPTRALGTYRTVLTRADLEAVIDEARRAPRIAVDTETNSQDPMRAKLVGISLAWTPNEGVYIPVGHDYLGAPAQLDV